MKPVKIEIQPLSVQPIGSADKGDHVLARHFQRPAQVVEAGVEDRLGRLPIGLRPQRFQDLIARHRPLQMDGKISEQGTGLGRAPPLNRLAATHDLHMSEHGDAKPFRCGWADGCGRRGAAASFPSA